MHWSQTATLPGTGPVSEAGGALAPGSPGCQCQAVSADDASKKEPNKARARTSERSKPSKRSCSASEKPWGDGSPLLGAAKKVGEPSARRTRKADATGAPAGGNRADRRGDAWRQGMVSALALSRLSGLDEPSGACDKALVGVGRRGRRKGRFTPGWVHRLKRAGTPADPPHLQPKRSTPSRCRQRQISYRRWMIKACNNRL